MRFEVNIPDSLYQGAQRAADASGLSMEAYVQQALQSQVEGVSVELTPEQVAKIAKAEAEIDAGNFFTAGQMREYFSKKKSAWTQSSPS